MNSKATLENNRLCLSQAELGKAIPNWSLESIFDDPIPSPESLKGKPLLVLFFNLGCPGCLGRAIPYANRMVYEQGDKINVLGIHTNFEGIDFDKVAFDNARKQLYIRFPFFKDINYDTSFLNYGAGGTPHWYLIDENGILVYSIFGSEPNNALLRLDLKMKEIFTNF